MSRVLALQKDGKLTRYCDDTCYNADSVHCTCICRGKNHGQGYARAVINSANLLVEEAAIRTLFPLIKPHAQLACNTDVLVLIQKLCPLPDDVDS